MAEELRNAASDLGAAIWEMFFDEERFDELIALVAEDFVQHDRRTLIGGQEMDKEAWTETARLFLLEVGLTAREREVLAVRGDRLVLTRFVDHHSDGSVREFLAVGEVGGDPLQIRRTVMFDADDREAALAELDRLADEIGD